MALIAFFTYLAWKFSSILMLVFLAPTRETIGFEPSMGTRFSQRVAAS